MGAMLVSFLLWFLFGGNASGKGTCVRRKKNEQVLQEEVKQRLHIPNNNERTILPTETHCTHVPSNFLFFVHIGCMCICGVCGVSWNKKNISFRNA